MNDQRDFDVVCIGAGLGSLAAAITAAKRGLGALVIEKSPFLGGVTAWSGGQLWAPGNHLAQEQGIEDTWQAGADHLERIGAGAAHRPLVDVFCQQTAEAVRYFESLGMKWQVIMGLPDYSYGAVEDGLAEGRYLEPQLFPADLLGDWQTRTRDYPYGLTSVEQLAEGSIANFISWDQEKISDRAQRDIRVCGPALSGWFLKLALDLGVEFEVNATVSELITTDTGEGLRVDGVRATLEDGTERQIGARSGVLIATGGYDWNPELVDRYDGHPEYCSAAPPSITGDHMSLAGSIGAQIAPNEVPAKPGAFGFLIPGSILDEGQPEWRPFQYGHPHAILVNREGRRFGEEAMYLDVTHAFTEIDGLRQRRKNDPCFVIFDNQYRTKYPVGGILPSEPLPETVSKAEDLAGLADALGIDGNGLEEQVAAFNVAAARGEDPEFDRGSNVWSKVWFGDPRQEPNAVLGPVSEPPYFGMRLIPGGYSVANAGIVADADARVLDYEDRPIEGLYVAGNARAKLDIGTGYQSGVANARGMTYGYIAGKDMATRAVSTGADARPASV
jgi:3-oxosteroid 1-dehydrogenase